MNDIDGERPFIYHEVIDMGSEPITMEEYTSLGKVTEFNVGTWISCIKNNGFECYNGYPGVSKCAIMFVPSQASGPASFDNVSEIKLS